MTPEHLHAYLRLGLTAWATVFLALGARSLLLAYHTDYGWPWRRRPGVNGRSHLDADLIVREFWFAGLGLATTLDGLGRVIAGGRLPLNQSSLQWTGFVLILAVFSFRVWRRARHERRRRVAIRMEELSCDVP